MDPDWGLEVRLELKRLIRDKRATRSWSPDGISRGYKRIDRQICQQSPLRNSRVGRHCYGGSRWADQFLLKCIIIGRYKREEESEDTHSAKPVNPTHTPRHSGAGERPASKSCQAHQQRTAIYTGFHADTSEQSNSDGFL